MEQRLAHVGLPLVPWAMFRIPKSILLKRLYETVCKVALLARIKPGTVLRQAVILVGGLGTRLGERTKTTPKPMLPVGGRPFLDTLIDEIARYDVFEEILLLAGHKAESIGPAMPAQSGDAPASRSRWNRRRSERLAPWFSRRSLQKRFLLLNGDSFSTSIFSIWCRAPNASLVQMALRADVVGDRSAASSWTASGSLLYRAWPGATGPVNAGVYVIDRSIIDGDRPPPRFARTGHIARARRQRRHERNVLSRIFHRHRHPRGFCAR